MAPANVQATDSVRPSAASLDSYLWHDFLKVHLAINDLKHYFWANNIMLSVKHGLFHNHVI